MMAKFLREEVSLMAEVRIEVPAELGLSQEQINQLTENFRNQLVGAMGGQEAQTAQTAQTLVRARPQSVGQSQVVRQVREIREIVEVR
jgi:hypothetical protein